MALAGAVLLFLIAPVVIIIIVSFSGADYLKFPPPFLSLRWYERFFGVPSWRQSIIISTQVAVLTMVFATVLGFLASLALVRGRFRGKGAIYAFLLSPMIVPTIITAIGLYFFFVRLKATGSILAMALGHTVLALPVVVIIITSDAPGLRPPSRAGGPQPRRKSPRRAPARYATADRPRRRVGGALRVPH